MSIAVLKISFGRRGVSLDCNGDPLVLGKIMGLMSGEFVVKTSSMQL